MAGILDRQDAPTNSDKKLNPNKFTSKEREKLLRGDISDEELLSVEYDTGIAQPSIDDSSGSSGKSGVNYDEETLVEFDGGNECEEWEFDPNSSEASETELKTISGLLNCNNVPESLKDEQNSMVEITKDVGDLEGKKRIKITIENKDTENCAFIESIRIIVGTSNSFESDKQTYINITNNSPLVSDEDILEFINAKELQINETSPSSLLDGVTTNLPTCLNSINDSLGILLGPNKEPGDSIVTGETYVVRKDLPPGSDNLIGFIGSTGLILSPPMATHIHAEWADVGTGTPKYWTIEEFKQWLKQNNKTFVPNAIRTRVGNKNGRGGNTNKTGVAAYFTVNDLLKFVDIDMLPLADQIKGNTPLPATINDFPDPDRNYAQYRAKGNRYHYAIDVYPNKASRSINNKAVRRIFLKPGVKIISAGGSNDGSTGNAVQLLHPDGNSILIYHLSALWDNKKNVYYTYANPKTTLNETNGGPALLSNGRTDLT